MELTRAGHPYYNSRSGGGEGHLEVAKNIYYSNKSLAHMVLSTVTPAGRAMAVKRDLGLDGRPVGDVQADLFHAGHADRQAPIGGDHLVALGQAADEIVGVDQPGSGHDLFVGSVEGGAAKRVTIVLTVAGSRFSAAATSPAR